MYHHGTADGQGFGLHLSSKDLTCRWRRSFHLTPDRTNILKLGFGEKGFTRRAVHALVVALINITLLVELFEDLLHLLLVVIVRGADELVVGGVH